MEIIQWMRRKRRFLLMFKTKFGDFTFRNRSHPEF
jgi:hypothetical protein